MIGQTNPTGVFWAAVRTEIKAMAPECNHR
jgi:hypothetical protein